MVSLEIPGGATHWAIDGGGELTVENAAHVSRVPFGGGGLGIPVVRRGFADPVCDSTPLLAAIVASIHADSEAQPDVQQVCRHFVSSGPPHVNSLEATAAALGIDRRRLATLTHRLAAAWMSISQSQLRSIETKLMSQQCRDRLVHYIESSQYDETPMSVRVLGEAVRSKGTGTNAPSSTALTIADVAAEQQLALYAGDSKLRSVQSSGKGQKLVQTQGDAGMVIRLGSQLVTIVQKCVFPLAVLEHTTAACLKHLSLTLSCIGPSAKAFKGLTRAATTDAFSGNKSAESSIARDRAGSSPTSDLHILCEAHASAGVYKKTFALVDSWVTGVVRIALALRTGACMARFRRCLREEIASRLVIKEGYPPMAALEHKKKVMRLFASHGTAVGRRRALLALCPNGDWRSQQVEYYTGGQQLRDPAVIQEHLASGLVLALASSQPTQYNRSRWTGADLVVDDLGVFECVHGLLSTTFARYCAACCSGKAKQHYLELGKKLGSLGDIECPLPLGDMPAEEDAEGAGQIDGVAEDDDLGDAGAGNDRAGEPGDFYQTIALRNAKDRRLSMNFLQHRPLASSFC